MRIIIYLILIISASPAFGQETMFVVAESGLIVRKSPDQQSERIGKLSYGTEVLTIELTGIESKVQDGPEVILGEWIKVQEVHGHQSGYVFGGYLVKNEVFTLINPNIVKLRRLVKSSQNTEVIYHYLSSNYASKGTKLELEYYDWDESTTCAFSQEFKPDIKYSIFQCKEAGGSSVELALPKVNRKNLMDWIEKISQVGQSGADNNVWKENNSRFEPKEIAPGCYYKIKEQEDSTLVTLYCGC